MDDSVSNQTLLDLIVMKLADLVICETHDLHVSDHGNLVFCLWIIVEITME